MVKLRARCVSGPCPDKPRRTELARAGLFAFGSTISGRVYEQHEQLRPMLRSAIEAQVAVLNAALDIDRKRAEDAIMDRDALRSQAERLTALTERRSWWKRLVG